MPKITEKWVFGPEAQKHKLGHLAGKKYLSPEILKRHFSALMKKAPFQFILMSTFLVPVFKGVQGNECIYENSCEHN